MSLAAAMLMGASAFAIENVKASGTANLFYHTEDDSVYMPSTPTPDMFDSAASAADFSLSIGATADLTTGVSAGVTGYGVSALGVEGQLVDMVWSGAHEVSANSAAAFAGGAEVDDAFWIGEAWLAGTVGKTTAKIGRMALDTPLAYTETWSVAPNTFESAVIMNQDIPDTTIVGAWVGAHNGVANAVDAGLNLGLGNIGLGGAADPVSVNGDFHTFQNDGAFALAVINNSFKPLTAQGWYYDVQSLATAYWLQVDLDMEGFLAGAQYTNIDVDGAADDDEAFALMAGYAIPDVATIKLAYSQVEDKGAIGSVNNLSTGLSSKLYTELWWWFTAGVTGAETVALTAEGTVGGVDLFAGYYNVDIDPSGALNNSEVTEFTVTAGKSFGPLDATVALIYDEFDQDAAWAADDLQDLTAFQVYLTYNF